MFELALDRMRRRLPETARERRRSHRPPTGAKGLIWPSPTSACSPTPWSGRLHRPVSTFLAEGYTGLADATADHEGGSPGGEENSILANTPL